jgi:beta-glucosidase
LRNEENGRGGKVLPLSHGTKVYVEGVTPESVKAYAEIVGSPEEADFAIIRIKAPYEKRTGGFEAGMHAGSLEFEEQVISHVNEICAKTPTVIDVYLDRPAILTPFAEKCAALVCNYGACDDALLSVLFGDSQPRGHLPFDIPRSMGAVERSDSDVPFDTENPIFKYGDGLTYGD